jgi:hypothetical protein
MKNPVPANPAPSAEVILHSALYWIHHKDDLRKKLGEGLISQDGYDFVLERVAEGNEGIGTGKNQVRPGRDGNFDLLEALVEDGFPQEEAQLLADVKPVESDEYLAKRARKAGDGRSNKSDRDLHHLLAAGER